MKFTTKLQLNALFIHLFTFVGLYYYWDFSYLWLTVLGNFLFLVIGNHIGAHRYFSHNAFQTTRAYEILFTVLAWFSTRGSNIGFCAAHKMHHVYSDRAQDPHPSTTILKTWFWFDNPEASKIPLKMSYVKHLLRKPEQVFMRDYYFIVYWSALAIFTVLFGFKFVLYFFLLTGIIGFHTAGCVNVLAHKFGYRNFNTKDTSTNLTWVNIITMGGGLHNNHHARAGSWTCKFRKGEWDPSAWLIKYVFATNSSELIEPELIKS